MPIYLLPNTLDPLAENRLDQHDGSITSVPPRTPSLKSRHSFTDPRVMWKLWYWATISLSDNSTPHTFTFVTSPTNACLVPVRSRWCLQRWFCGPLPYLNHCLLPYHPCRIDSLLLCCSMWSRHGSMYQGQDQRQPAFQKTGENGKFHLQGFSKYLFLVC